jgi:PAS domain S-box-containing protein
MCAAVRSGRVLPRDNGVAPTDGSMRDGYARLLVGVLESSTDAVMLVDPAGMLCGWSDAASRVFGLSREEAIGRTFAHLLAPERRDETLRSLLDESRGTTARTTSIALRRDGSRFIVEAACSSARDPVSGPFEHVIVLRDVTEPTLVRAAAASVAHEPDGSAALSSFAVVLQQVLPVDNLTLLALEGDTARRVASAGSFAGELRSGEVIPIVTTHLADHAARRQRIVCSDTRKSDIPHDQVLARAGVHAYVVLPLFRAGEVVATLNVAFARAGAPNAQVVELLTSLTASIMPIVLNLVTLEEQAGAIRKLEQLDALKNEFLALIAHDMRTPLAVIAGFAEQLRSRWRDLAEDEKLESVDTILRNGRSLYRLVEEGLQVARIESGQFAYELRDVSLEDEVRRTVADLAFGDSDRIHVIAEQGLPAVRCDPGRHWQILTNLLTNALKFSSSDTTVEVEVRREDSMVRVAVRDHGAGIDADDLPKLFQKFSRVGAHDRTSVGGVGLGLYIAKAMVEAQGGRIFVESTPGRGSTFAYTLPAAGP